MAIVLTEDVITRNGPSDGSVLSPEAVGLFLLTGVFIYIIDGASPKRPFTPSLTFKDCLAYSLLMTPINALITGVVMLIIPPLRNWFFLTYCIVFWIYVWIDHYQSQKKRQAKLSPVNRPSHPASANYLTSPITAQSAPTRGALQGVHPIGKFLFMIVGGGLLLVVSFYGTVWIFDYFDYTPKTREAICMFLIVMGMIVFPLWFLLSRSEKNMQKQLSSPQPQHPSQYRPKPFAQRKIAAYTPATQITPQAAEASPAAQTTPQAVAEASPAAQTASPTTVEPSPVDPAAQEIAKISSAEQATDDRPLCIRRTTRTRNLPRRDRHR